MIRSYLRADYAAIGGLDWINVCYCRNYNDLLIAIFYTMTNY